MVFRVSDGDVKERLEFKLAMKEQTALLKTIDGWEIYEYFALDAVIKRLKY